MEGFGVARGLCAVVFFFQAEDGIRDGRVTGVQTCALPIWATPDLVPVGARPREGALAIEYDEQRFEGRLTGAVMGPTPPDEAGPWRGQLPDRSEERRVGKEGRSRGGRDGAKGRYEDDGAER